MRHETPADWFQFAPEGTNLTANFTKLLASPAIASKRWITEQYDTSVRTNTLAGPGASDAAVIRIKDPQTGIVKRALALATDGNGRWCQLNPRVGAMHAVAEAARNVATSGARPIAATNCLNFGSPEKPEVMWQFSEAIDGLTVACTELGTPITGGNVSFYNETLGKSIYPTPVIGVLGILNDANRVLKIAFRNAGDVILLLDGLAVGPTLGSPAGERSPAPKTEFAREFSSSEYSKSIAHIVSGEPPTIDLAAEKRLIDCLVTLANEDTLQSAHDISDGGLAVTVAESCFAAAPVRARHAVPVLGATINLGDSSSPAEHAIFNERGARCVVSVSPTNLAAVLATARQYNVDAREIGKVHLAPAFRIEYKGASVIDSPLDTLRDVWTNSLERNLKVRP
jgi:phosphoribosylformylglycinamidine synthase